MIIIVLSATVSGLQEMLNICNQTIMGMDLLFNCIRFGSKLVKNYLLTDLLTSCLRGIDAKLIKSRFLLIYLHTYL